MRISDWSSDVCSSDLTEMAPLIAARGSPLLLLGLTFTVIGIAFKLAALPVHSWMPAVAEGAPAPAAAFLTVVPNIGAEVALVRVVDLLPVDAFAIRPLVAVVSLVTIPLGTLDAICKTTLRPTSRWKEAEG